MLTEQTIHNIKETTDQTLMNLFNLNPDQLQACEESELNPDQTSFFDYKIESENYIPQFFTVMIQNHPLQDPKLTIITTTDHKLEDDTWWIHNPSNIVNSARIPETDDGNTSLQFYENLKNQLGLATFAKQIIEPKALARIIPDHEGYYTEIEPLNTKVPLNETEITFLVSDNKDNPYFKLTVPSAVWLERDEYTKNTYPIEQYMYDTDQEQFRLHAYHIGDPTLTEIERRSRDTQFYEELRLCETPSMRFPFKSPESFATLAGHSLWQSRTPTSVTYLQKTKYTSHTYWSHRPVEPDDEPSL